MSDLAPNPSTPEQPAEPDSAASLAADLRALRLEADSPTLMRLQAETGISRSVLSDAFAGKNLPTVRTIDRLVRACHGDPAPWVARRDRIARLLDPQEVPDDADAAPAAEGSGRVARTIRRSTAIILVIAALIVGSVGGGLTSGLVVVTVARESLAQAASTPVTQRAQINVATGLDPAQTPCVNDAKVATGVQRDNVLIEIIWSNKCYAGWARITRYDKWEGESVSISIYPETAATGPLRQDASEGNVQGAYTTLIVRPTEDTRLCAVGSFTVDGTSVDAGPPICT